MSTSIHLIAVTVVLVSWLAVVAVMLRTAPVAYQDRHGFHVGEGLDEE